MSLRLKDFRCPDCGHLQEEMVVVEDEATTIFRHCSSPMVPMPGAPMIRFVEAHFNRPLGQFVKDAGDLERKQKAQGIYTPTKQDIERAMDSDPMQMLKPSVEKRKAELRARAEKEWSYLHGTGKVKEFAPA